MTKRIISYTTRFKKDFKRESRSGKHKQLEKDFLTVVALLASDSAMAAKYCDHSLEGEWSDHRDCHIKPDLVLIYRKFKNELQLVRLGSHSELGL